MYASIVALVVNVTAADYIPRSEVRLPEQRYVLESKTTEMIGGAPCETLVVEDTWDSIRKKKVSELENVMEDQSECHDFRATGLSKDKGTWATILSREEGFDCMGIYFPCIREGSIYTEKCGYGKNEMGCRSVYDREGCIEYSTTRSKHITHQFIFVNMNNIYREDGWFDDTDVIIGDEHIDFENVASATRAAALLEDLRYISTAIKGDSHTVYPLKQQAEEAPQICAKLREQEKQRQREALRLEKEKKYVERIKPLQNRIKQELANCAELHNPTNMGECLSKVKSKYEIIDYDEIPRIID